MTKRYLPTIITEDGREYYNITHRVLGEAMGALETFIKIFSYYNDAKIKDAYVLNITTGKHIYP